MNSLKLRALPNQGYPWEEVRIAGFAHHHLLVLITLAAIAVVVCASETLSSDRLTLTGSSGQLAHADIPGM